MNLPAVSSQRRDAIIEVARMCSPSRSQRKAYHRDLREMYVRGTAMSDRAKYNKLRAHVRQSTAYLFQSESVRFGMALPPHFGDTFAAELDVVRDDFHRAWHDSDAGEVMAMGVEWSHVYPSVIFKVTASAGEPLVTLVPDPGDIGVLEEDRKFDRQEAMIHYFYMNLRQFARLVAGHPREEALKEQARAHADMGGGDEPMTGTVERLVFDQVGTPMSGGGALVQTPMTAVDAQIEAPRVLMAELWVVDDRIHDWRCVTCLAPAGEVLDIVWDRRAPVLSGVDPFVQLRLSGAPDYTWGLSEVDDLSGLQEWRERRMDQIDRLMELQLDPPVVLGGFGGLSEERARRLRTPGGTLATSIPNPTVNRLAPQMPPEAFGEVKEIDNMFADQSGLPILLQGQSDPSIRAGNQVGVMATLASARVRENAMLVERACSKVATLVWRLRRALHDEPLMKPDGSRFLLTQIPKDAVVLVASHSTSPLYAAAVGDKADRMLKAGAIDLPSYVELLDPPQLDTLRAKARRLAEQRAKHAERLMALQEMKALRGRAK